MPFSRKFLLNLRQEKKPRLNNATLLLARFLRTRASSGYCYGFCVSPEYIMKLAIPLLEVTDEKRRCRTDSTHPRGR